MNRTRLAPLLLALTSLCCVPGTASAHLVSVRFGDFYTGLIHPLTAFENALPWLALAMFAGLHGPVRARWMLIAFPAAVAAGAAFATAMPYLANIQTLNTLSFVLLGALVALGRRTSLSLLTAIAITTGFVHGYDNGLAFTVGGNALLFVSGVGCAAYLFAALIMAGTLGLAAHGWGRIAVRAVGSWIAAIGIMLLGLALGST
jgi:hydrogenase/urease accessory protein HupE